jgi:hypothetical protein
MLNIRSGKRRFERECSAAGLVGGDHRYPYAIKVIAPGNGGLKSEPSGAAGEFARAMIRGGE